MKVVSAIHEKFYQDLAQLLDKHAGNLPADEMLAIAANMVGKIIAFQDQRTMTREMAMLIVLANIKEGNRQVVDELSSKTTGSA
jgi:hypothetical protein